MIVARWILKNKIVILVFLSALILRLSISNLGFHDDLYSNTAWGKWIFENGPKGFYETRGWIYSSPTQPPLISLLYGFNHYLYERLMFIFATLGVWIAIFHLIPTKMLWFFNFSTWFGNSMYGETPFKFGALISMKLVAILADLAIALIIFLLARGKTARPILWSMVYLFSPFSWYLSALWGQYDQLSTFLLLASFLLLYKRYFFLSVLFLLFSGQAKPTSAYFLPLYIFYFFSQKPRFISIIFSIVGAVSAFWVMTAPFADRNPFSYTAQIIYQKVFFAERFEGLVNRSFNIWQFLEPLGGRSWFRYLGIPAYVWGYFSLVIFYIWSLLIASRKKNLEGLITASYILAGGIYLFGTGMVDRYFFPAVILLIILTTYHLKLWKLCLLTIALFSLNLFYSWGFPFLDRYQVWQNIWVIRVLSFAQVVTFIFCLKELNLFEEWIYLKNKTFKFISKRFSKA